MKKLLTVMLAAMMLLAMVACGNNTPEPTPTPDETKTLYMATEGTFPPYEYYDGDKLVGIDVEVAGAIAEKLGMKLEIQDVEFGAIVAGVESGKYDIGMAGMTVTEDRKKQVSFSTTYATGVQVVIVKEDSPRRAVGARLPSPVTRAARMPCRHCRPASWTASSLTRSLPSPSWHPTAG